MCVFVCQKKRAASCQRGGVKRPWGFEHSRPAGLTVCLDNGIFTSTSPSLHRSSSLPWRKISQQRGKPLLFPLYFCQPMSVLSFFIAVLPLSAIISPPPFFSLRSVHPPPVLRSNPTAINQLLVSSGGGGAGILLTFSLNCLPHSAAFHLFLSTCDTFYSRLLGWQTPIWTSWFFSYTWSIAYT